MAIRDHTADGDKFTSRKKADCAVAGGSKAQQTGLSGFLIVHMLADERVMRRIAGALQRSRKGQLRSSIDRSHLFWHKLIVQKIKVEPCIIGSPSATHCCAR